MIREIVTATQHAIKLGVVDSQVASVRTQVEEETAVRVYSDGLVGVASGVGQISLDSLTERAREALLFKIPYAPTPSASQQHEASHRGSRRTLSELVDFTEALLETLRSEFPDFVLSQGIEQRTVEWRISNDQALDLRYARDTTELGLIVKEKGSPNIIDTALVLHGADLDSDGALEECRAHLSAYRRVLKALPRGRQRIVFAGLEPHRGGGLLRLLRSDLVARKYARGASVFSGRLDSDEAQFNDKLHITDCRDPAQVRICPFDMEGVIRAEPELDLIRDGRIRNVVANKRDALRYGLKATGSAMGSISQVPGTGISRIRVAPTAESLVELLEGQPGVLAWFVTGGDTTQAGDIALPTQVLMRVEADGTVSGRYPGCTLAGNLYEILGDDLVGISRQRIDPFSEEPYLVTHMNVVD